jgi:hypothetical protein
MKTLSEHEYEQELQALVCFVIGLVLIGLGIWRALSGEWTPASILFVGGGVMWQ